MRRMALLLAATLVVLVALGGAALAHELIRGTEGPDELAGDRHPNRVLGLGGDDTLRGRGGVDDLRGGEGYDLLYGARGDDVLRNAFGGSSFGRPDAAFGGPGDDEFYGVTTIIARDYTEKSVVRGGEGGDLYRANYAQARDVSGGDGDDDLYGGPANDELRGDGGADSLFAGGSCAFAGDPEQESECEYLGEPDNRLHGGGGDDDLHGGRQDRLHDEGDGDMLDGGEGRDVLDGGDGDDFELRGGPGEDTIAGGEGADTVFAQDGEKDEVDCGGNFPGTGDTAFFDEGLDVVSNCETQNPPTAP